MLAVFTYVVGSALLLHFVHDNCHGTVFVASHGYKVGEMTLPLHCERGLWNATSAREWFEELRRPSSYGIASERLQGFPFQEALSHMSNPQEMEVPLVLPPAALFVMVKMIVRELFDVCFMNFKNCRSEEMPLPSYDPEILKAQYRLRNWIHCWAASPDVTLCEQLKQELPYYENGLPFYWLGQASIVHRVHTLSRLLTDMSPHQLAIFAYQKRQAPFQPQYETNAVNRFQLLRNLQGNVREFLAGATHSKNLQWEDLQRIHIQSRTGIALMPPERVVDSKTADAAGIVGLFRQ